MSPPAAPKCPPGTTPDFRRKCPTCEGDGATPRDRRAGYWHPNDPRREDCGPCEGTGTVGVECLACGGGLAEDGRCDCGARHCVDCAREGWLVAVATGSTFCAECLGEGVAA